MTQDAPEVGSCTVSLPGLAVIQTSRHLLGSALKVEVRLPHAGRLVFGGEVPAGGQIVATAFVKPLLP